MLKIFIVTHKDYNPTIELDPEVYTLISNHEVKNNSNLPHIVANNRLDDKIWSELSCLLHIYEQIIPSMNDDDYIGIEHYRRHLDLVISSKIHEMYDCIVPEVMMQSANNTELYQEYHNINDLLLLDTVMMNSSIEYYDSWKYMINSNFLFPYNMLICKVKYYKQYLNFLFKNLMIFMNNIHQTSDNEYEYFVKYVSDKKSEYTENRSGQNATVNYQIRIPGFLSERLTTTWLFAMMKRGAIFDFEKVKLLEENMIV